MNILGVHVGHDSGAALIREGRVVADVSEERFNHIKHYGSLPLESISFCLKAAGIKMIDVDAIATTTRLGDPAIRILFGLTDDETDHIRKNNNEKRIIPGNLRRKIRRAIWGSGREGAPLYISPFKRKGDNIPILKVDHHLAHAASAYYTSGYENTCLVITCDGEGDNVSTAVWRASQGIITPFVKYGWGGSFGWFYGIVTEALDWWIGDGEGKTMGLAPYGNPDAFDDNILKDILPEYVDGLLKKEVNFGEIEHLVLMGAYHWHFKRSEQIKDIVQRYGREDVSAKAQKLLENEMKKFIADWVHREKASNLAVAGGVFLNVKLNQKIVEEAIVDNYYIFPGAGDSGLAVGAALYVFNRLSKKPVISKIEDINWGPSYTNPEIEAILKERNLPYEKIEDIAEVSAKLLADGKILGWFQGRMECGPRALGSRSILFDPRKKENKDIINARVKFREPFRPFCPSMTWECVPDYLYHTRDERYMITAYKVRNEKAKEIPAVVHVDGTCRPQFVHKETHPLYWRLLHRFGELTGTPVILNTSFNIKGDPIVCNPRDAIKCFYDTGIDHLSIGEYLLSKNVNKGS
jgi:carbamoyltransferase